jgi:tryptophan synthase alpha chain
VGFGIKTPEMAANVAAFADGAIVGAALISEIHAAYLEKKDPIKAGATLINSMRCAMDNEGSDHE